MAYRIIRSEWNGRQVGREIVAVLDSAEDLDALGSDYAPGSAALVADRDGAVYLMNASGVWKEM